MNHTPMETILEEEETVPGEEESEELQSWFIGDDKFGHTVLWLLKPDILEPPQLRDSKT